MDLFDQHVHSTFSFDGKSTPAEQCQSAIDKNLSGICFTEHFSVDPRDVSFGFMNYPAYRLAIESCKEKFDLKICRGLEIGEPHLEQYADDLKNFLRGKQLDFIIGSVHNIGGVKLRKYLVGKTKDELYENYFAEILKMVEKADIDIVGHCDLVKMYGFIAGFGNYDFERYENLFRKIFSLIIERGIGIELNTAGWRKESGEQYPKIEVLRLYKNLGGEIITLGSDSHKVKDIGADFGRAVEILKAVGFKNYYRFVDRKAQAVSLEE